MLFNVHLVCVSVRMMCDVPGLYSCARGDGFNANANSTCIEASKKAGARYVSHIHVQKQRITLLDRTLFIIVAVRTASYITESPRRAQVANRASNLLQRTGICECPICENEPSHESTDLF